MITKSAYNRLADSRPCRKSESRLLMVVALLSALFVPSMAKADRFVVIDEKGDKMEIIGRLHGSGRGTVAIEKQDGQIEQFAQAAILERDSSVEWKPVPPEKMAEQLTDEYGEDLFRSRIDGNVVVGMVLMAPIERSAESEVDGFLRKASQFMNNVSRVFEDFAEEMRLDIHDSETPLVLLIFESDKDFNEYAAEVTRGQGLSVARISGFYNGLTNFLSIRMAECASFEVPLHEAIHQQVYNRGLLQRLAPIPTWFDEGIATGFEANKDRIRSGPIKVHSRYARKAPAVEQLNWSNLISEDVAFQGDVMAGDAYCLAWCLHWLLVNERPEQYSKYVEMLGTKEPLAKEDASTRKEDFRKFFGDDIDQLAQEFVRALNLAMRRQRGALEPEQKPGYYHSYQGMAEIELSATSRLDRGGLLEVEGRIRNINPLRNLTFSVSVVTDGGTYAQWILPNITSSRIVRLKKQYAQKVVPGQQPRASNSFRVNIQSVLPDSDQAKQWRRGEGPDPTEG